MEFAAKLVWPTLLPIPLKTAERQHHSDRVGSVEGCEDGRKYFVWRQEYVRVIWNAANHEAVNGPTMLPREYSIWLMGCSAIQLCWMLCPSNPMKTEFSMSQIGWLTSCGLPLARMWGSESSRRLMMLKSLVMLAILRFRRTFVVSSRSCVKFLQVIVYIWFSDSAPASNFPKKVPPSTCWDSKVWKRRLFATFWGRRGLFLN